MLEDFSTDAEIDKLIQFACGICGFPGLEDQITWKWNSRLTACMGNAEYKQAGDRLHSARGKINLSSALWSRATPADRRNTVIHEACHVICAYKHGRIRQGRRRRRSVHGEEWKQLMRTCGEEPERTHNVDTTGLERKRKKQPKTVVYCGCGEHPIGHIKASRMKRGLGYKCCTCKQSLTLEKPKDAKSA